MKKSFKRIAFEMFPYDFRRFVYSKFRKHQFEILQEMRLIDAIGKTNTYKPFDENKCIFVRIPKSASMSVTMTLFGNISGGHNSIRDYQIIFSKKNFENYFKFAFVRNPWDRVFSAYNFLKRGGINEGDRIWSSENLESVIDFEDFVTNYLRKPSIQKHIHFIPQYEFLISYNNKLAIDFLGFFENIKNDFNYVKKKLSKNNSILEHINKTNSNEKKKDYTDFYSDEMKDIVEEIYKKDIELFGYNFDNSSLERQIEKRDKSLN